MKKLISDLIIGLGCIPKYSGKSKTMFIHEPMNADIFAASAELTELAVLERFGYSLPFKLYSF